jgi:hypothetical protein
LPKAASFPARVDAITTNAPQTLSAKAIQELRVLYAAEFGEVLTDDEAEEIGIRLLRFFKILTEQTGKTLTGENDIATKQ